MKNISRTFKIPHVKKPCKHCPFRKDAKKGWLGEDRMKDFLDTDSFVCHKNPKLQCAGHMILKGNENVVVRAAKIMEIPITLEGEDLVFESKNECSSHHAFTKTN